MNTPSYDELIKRLGSYKQQIQSGTIPKLIVIYGGSEFLLFKCTEFLKSCYTKANIAVTQVDGLEINSDRIDDIFSQKSIFSSDSAFFMQRAEKCPNLAKAMAACLTTSDIGNYLVLVWKANKIPEKSKKQIQRLSGEFLQCSEPNFRELSGFIASLANKHGLKLDAKAIKLIETATGRNLATIDNELKRLSLIFVEESQVLTEGDVSPYLNLLREDYAYTFRNLILDLNYGKAQLLLSELIKRGESALALLGVLAKHCRNSLQVKELLAKGNSPRQIAATTGLQIYLINSYTRYIAKTSQQRLIAALNMCSWADRKIKSSRISDEIVLSYVLSALH